jgi:hypothetical protein
MANTILTDEEGHDVLISIAICRRTTTHSIQIFGFRALARAIIHIDSKKSRSFTLKPARRRSLRMLGSEPNLKYGHKEVDAGATSDLAKATNILGEYPGCNLH